METQLYIRIRGRVLGPYDQEKLQSLARRGQLSRMHELSQDATNWVRASTFPELFVSEDHSVAVVMQQVPGETHDGVQRQGPTPMPSGRRWWYRKNGSETGPVDETTLQQTLASGGLGADELVWTEGMPQWVPARQVPGLLPVQSAPWLQQDWRGPVTGTGDQKDGLPASLCKATTNSRPWILFVAVASFVWAVFWLVGGIVELIAGAKKHSPDEVAGGLFMLILGIDCAAGGFLLLAYASRVANLKFSSHVIVLEKALDALRAFWIFVSINLIVILAFAISGFVYAFAVGVTFPWL